MVYSDALKVGQLHYLQVAFNETSDKFYHLIRYNDCGGKPECEGSLA